MRIHLSSYSGEITVESSDPGDAFLPVHATIALQMPNRAAVNGTVGGVKRQAVSDGTRLFKVQGTNSFLYSKLPGSPRKDRAIRAVLSHGGVLYVSRFGLILAASIPCPWRGARPR